MPMLGVWILSLAVVAVYGETLVGNPEGDWLRSNGYLNTGTQGSAWDPSSVRSNGFVAPAGISGAVDYSFMMQLRTASADYNPSSRATMLNSGNKEHWLINSLTNYQMGRWGGPNGTPDPNIPIGEEVILVSTTNAGTTSYKFYIDGVVSYSAATAPTGATTLTIGDTSYDNSGAEVYRVAYWSYALSETQILELNDLWLASAVGDPHIRSIFGCQTEAPKNQSSIVLMECQDEKVVARYNEQWKYHIHEVDILRGKLLDTHRYGRMKIPITETVCGNTIEFHRYHAGINLRMKEFHNSNVTGAFADKSCLH